MSQDVRNSGVVSQRQRANGLKPFARVPSKELGYERKQVDDFIERARYAYQGQGELMTAQDVRGVSFDAVKGGYICHQVDQVLDRLEEAFARADRDQFIEDYGEDAWNDYLDVWIRSLMGRLTRPDGARFRGPSKNTVPSYRSDEVDWLCRKLYGHLTDTSSVTIKELRDATFRPSENGRGYEEAQVDTFIADAIELLVVLD